ncbi:hypothetical protein K0817_015960 [Microbacterium sp. HD4P20]|uniref:hypothetical protein n=1 Tax=Microbacterium sp. HD4P20 TaxID=2864874 RepID=UPI001C63E395|nr:hypothetical protein [Microbacterium sp. HD4P20]MCP2638049.1 hypothetical protein [Microbacterium sp. HD4P20]
MTNRSRRARIVRREPMRPDGSAIGGAVPFGGLPAGHHTRLRAGAYVLTSEWEHLFSEGKLRTRAVAVAERCGFEHAAFCRTAAAACHGLPVYRMRSDRVDMIVASRTTRHDGSDVVRHQEPLPAQDVVVIDGLRVTSLDRTVYDVIRTATPEAAIAVYDAALRAVAWDDDTRTYDVAKAEAFRDLVDARISRGAGARGIRQARFISEIADGRAQLPGESVTRLWMLQLGVPAPELQYRIDFSDGGFVLLDFAWPKLGRWMEFDGEAKLTEPEFMGGRTVAEVLADQALREERVRQVTGWRCDRHGFERMPSFEEFAVYLRTIRLR